MQIKVFFYLDFDAFYASIEELRYPQYMNLPIVVGGNADNSVVCSANYIARSYGVHAAMPYFKAKKLLPKNAIYLKADLALYENVSKKIFAYIKRQYTSFINIYSVDECWFVLNLPEKNWYNIALNKAKFIQDDIFSKFKLSISIGIGLSMFLAKMASNLKKPLGLSLIKNRDDVKALLWPLPINKMFMVGKSLSKRLNTIGINTIGDLANFKDIDLLKNIFNKNYLDYINNANGYLLDVEVNDEKPKSFSIKRTFASAMSEGVELFAFIKDMIKELVNCLNAVKGKAKKLTCIIESTKNKNYKMYFDYSEPIFTFDVIHDECFKLFDQIYFQKNFMIRSLCFALNKISYEDFDEQLKIKDLSLLNNKTKDNINWQHKVINLINQVLDSENTKVGSNFVEKNKMHFRH